MRYNGEVKYADDLLGEILAAIDRNVGIDRSLIVLTSDHGEEFGEHGMEEHGHSLHREVVHVPLIIAAPDLPAGRRVESCVRLLDIFPTVLSAAGLDGSNPPDIDGVDLSPLVEGERRNLVVYSAGMLYGSTERSLFSGDFRLMWDEQGDRYRLFRISTDPGETRDVAAGFEKDVARMRDALNGIHDRFHREFLRSARPPAAADSLASREERERILEAMKALGYIDG